MSTLGDVLRQAEAAGIRLWLEDGRVRFAPKDAPPDLVALLRQHKPELLTLLSLPREIPSLMRPCWMCGSRLYWRRVEDSAALCWRCCTPKGIGRVVALVTISTAQPTVDHHTNRTP